MNVRGARVVRRSDRPGDRTPRESCNHERERRKVCVGAAGANPETSAAPPRPGKVRFLLAGTSPDHARAAVRRAVTAMTLIPSDRLKGASPRGGCMNARVPLAAAVTIAALALLAGCKGDTGPQGPPGPPGSSGDGGTNVTADPDSPKLPGTHRRLVHGLGGAATSGDHPERHHREPTGGELHGDGRRRKSNRGPGQRLQERHGHRRGLDQPRLRPREAGARRQPAAPSKWVSYIVTTVPTTTAAAAPTRPTTDNTGTLIDNGDGTYSYTFYRDVTRNQGPGRRR